MTFIPNSNVFNPTPNAQQPGIGNDVTGALGQNFGLAWTNSLGSEYATSYSKTMTALIAKEIEKEIFSTTPKQYETALSAFMYMNPMQTHGSDELTYFEKSFGRSPLTVYSWTYNTSATTGTLLLAGTFTEANDIPVGKGDIITLPGTNKPAIVTTITWSANANSSSIVVTQYSGASATFTALDTAVGDLLPLQSTSYADGMDFINRYDRIDTISRHNNLQLFARARRWGVIEMQKWLNMGTTDYMANDKENSIEQLKNDMLVSIINGTLGEYYIPSATSGGTYGKAMGGIYPAMVAAGSPSASVTPSGIQPALESLMFQTNTLAKGATRFLLGTDEMLYEISKTFKNPIVYHPNDTVANMNLMSYEIGTMKVVPMVIPQFGESSLFPAFFSRMIIGMDMSSFSLWSMKGIPHITMGQIPDKSGGQNLNGYSDFWIQGSVSSKFQNPSGGFLINVL